MSRSQRANEVASDGLAALLKLAKSVVDDVPIASGIAGGLMWITDTARQFKSNKDAWKNFSEYTATLRDDIQALVDKSSPSATPDLLADISNLKAPLLRIASEMQQMKKRSMVSKFLQSQEDPKKIVIFRQMLADASTKFNTAQLVAIRLKLEIVTRENEDNPTSNSTQNIKIPMLKLCPPPSQIFVGRQDILDHMTNYLKSNSKETKQRVFVLCGLGGCGKSQLAFKFVQLSQSEPKRFSEVFMIDATTTETIEADLKILAQAKSLGDSFEMALQWLAAQSSDWLIVFDNADDINLNLREYFPKCLHGNILITTRNQAVRLHGSGPNSHFNVAEMGCTDAESLLVRILETAKPVDDKTRALVVTLAAELGWFALALVQVGSYIITSECGVGRYLEMFRARKGELLEEQSINAQKLDNYQHSTYTTWRLSFEKLSERATQFLQLCCFFHHSGLTERMFRIACTNAVRSKWVLKDTLRIIKIIFGVEWDALNFLNVMSEIRSFSLINFDSTNEVYSIHPLVQSWIRIHLRLATATRQAAHSILALCIDLPVNGWEHSQFYSRTFEDSLIIHADAALREDPVECAEVAERLASMYLEAEAHVKAIPLYNAALRFQEVHLKGEYPEAVENYCRLSRSYADMGKWMEAVSSAQQAYITAKEVMDPQHRLVFKCAHTLANAWYRSGMLGKAEELLRSSLEECRIAHGSSDWNTVDIMSGLGVILAKRDKLSESEVMLLEAVNIRTHLKGSEDGETLTLMQALSHTYHIQGQYNKAERILLDLIEISKAAYGPHHKMVLSFKHSLAATYRLQKRFEEAERLYLDVLDCFKRVFEPQYPDILVAKGNLAHIYLSQRQLDKAERIFKEVLANEVWGVDHYVRQKFKSYLARVYHLQKRTEDSTDLMEEVLERLTIELGSEHHWTIEAKNDLLHWKEETDCCYCDY